MDGFKLRRFGLNTIFTRRNLLILCLLPTLGFLRSAINYNLTQHSPAKQPNNKNESAPPNFTELRRRSVQTSEDYQDEVVKNFQDINTFGLMEFEKTAELKEYLPKICRWYLPDFTK